MIWADFEDGRYSEIIGRIRPPGANAEESAALIASLAFLGRMQEAVGLWRLRRDSLTPAFRQRARFALAVSATRISRFQEARRWLREARDEGPLEDAFDLQSFAFYFYFHGNFRRASVWAKRALDASLLQENPYIRLLASDLLGHALVQRGKLSVGFRWFDQSRKLAQQRGNSALGETIRLSKLVYEAEAGFRPLSIVAEIEKAVAEREEQDSYSRADLVLELSRQWTLRGRWREARELLDRESPRIYSFENRHQEMDLLLRLAEVSLQQGRAADAGHFLRSARRALNRLADQVYEMRLLHLEIKVETELLGRDLPLEKKKRLLDLSEGRSDRVNRQMLSRRGWIREIPATPGEDPMHDLLLLARTDPREAEKQMIERGYWGLWARLRGLPFGTEALVKDVPHHSLVRIDADGVRPLAERLGPVLTKLLEHLSKGFVDKQELIEKVWGYRYDPLRHDALVYKGLSSIRRLLGERGDWLENSEDGWRLKPGVLRRRSRPADEEEAREAPTPEEPAPDLLGELNLRQITALKEMKRREAWVMRDYRSFFQVSTMTAFRDLDDLVQKGYIRKHGKGRATAYVLPGRTS